MKRTLFAAAIAVGFAATAAYAQTDNPPPPPKAPAAGAPEAAPPPPPPHHPGPEARGGPEGPGGPGMHGKWGHPGPWMKHHMMMMSKGAHIRVSDGDVHVNVKCAEDDSTAECGQTVIRILKQMQSSDQSGYQDQGDDSDNGGADNNGSGNGGDDQMMNE